MRSTILTPVGAKVSNLVYQIKSFTKPEFNNVASY